MSSIEQLLMPTVLIADDNADHRQLLKDFLSDEGYAVLLAKDGLEAVQIATRDVGVIVMDLEMPNIGGLAASRILRGNPETSEIPILMLSGRTDTGLEARVRRAGAMEFLQKPVSLFDLRTRIGAMTRLSAGVDAEGTREVLSMAVELEGLAQLEADASRQVVWYETMCGEAVGAE